jgi:cholesterol transport system auxiliary component
MHASTRTSLVALLALGLAGCASLGGTTPPDTYELAAPRTAPVSRGRNKVQILIPAPTATKTLDGNQIVIKPTPYTVEYLAQSQWSDRLPALVQARFVQAFENTGRLAAVGVPGQGLAIDYQIAIEIRKFEVDVDNGNQAVVEFSVKALNDRNGTVRATRVFAASAPVGSVDSSTASGKAAYVAALNAAFASVTGEVVAWTLSLV